MKRFLFILNSLLFITASEGFSQDLPQRTELLRGQMTQNVSSFQVQQIIISGGGIAPKHLHPSPVVGYVLKGAVRFQIEGEEERLLREGDAFYEPRNKRILHFDNISTDEQVTFVAIYLKEGSEENTRVIPEE